MRSLIRLVSLTVFVGISSGAIFAQSTTTPGLPVAVAKPTIPDQAALVRMGHASTLAEAQPLMDQYKAEEESLFQERRAALLRMQGKTEAEKRQIWQALVVAQKDRLEKQRELAAKFAAIEKQEREKLLKAGAAKPGKS